MRRVHMNKGIDKEMVIHKLMERIDLEMRLLLLLEQDGELLNLRKPYHIAQPGVGIRDQQMLLRADMSRLVQVLHPPVDYRGKRAKS
jgi:hypothetical protein